VQAAHIVTFGSFLCFLNFFVTYSVGVYAKSGEKAFCVLYWVFSPTQTCLDTIINYIAGISLKFSKLF